MQAAAGGKPSFLKDVIVNDGFKLYLWIAGRGYRGGRGGRGGHGGRGGRGGGGGNSKPRPNYFLAIKLQSPPG